ncbi:MAG: hypothetical protein ISR85_06895 [Kiritimatiellales bacterium]|nr:hypothetical protein [Kiritimatiellota bacterium]MBL7012635.1 hypothetical protein [Kiritimatiellales bacterium]
MKKLALACVLVLALVCAWGLMSSGVSVTVNGQEIEGPLKAVVGGWSLVITTVTLFCVGILLAFVLAGVGLVVLGVLALAGLILVGIAFPFLLPLLIPLFIVWAFCAGIRRGKEAKEA